jgi:hypothetical protein
MVRLRFPARAYRFLARVVSRYISNLAARNRQVNDVLANLRKRHGPALHVVAAAKAKRRHRPQHQVADLQSDDPCPVLPVAELTGQ